MKINVMLHLSYDDVHEILPFALICTTRESSAWETGKRKRAWLAQFTPEERERATDIFRCAHSMYLKKGVPENGLMMYPKTYDLWQKIGAFCASV